MSDFNIDLCSDLHIDQWDTNIFNKYPNGHKKDFPFKFSNNTGAKYLIIAGDISDNLNNSINYLNDVTERYDKVLLVDGNHEHVNKYPKLYTTKYINERIQELNNDKIVYLPEQDYVDGTTVFIGKCGWWNYPVAYYSGNYDLSYFDDWIPEFTDKQRLEFILSVKDRAMQEAKVLKDKVERYQKDPNYEKIVIVTHCLPSDILSEDKKNRLDTNYNSHFSEIVNGNYSKLTHWFFGHTHEQLTGKINNIVFMTNPRGRPEDYDREVYSLKTLDL